MEAKEVLRADKVRLGRADALTLAKAASRVVVVRGKNVVTFDMEKSPPSDAALARMILGPTGKLRAPTMRAGRTLLVGFNEKILRDHI